MKDIKDKGTVYIIKDGKVRTFEINPKVPYSDVENTVYDDYKDEKEINLASKLLGISSEKAKKLSVPELYAALVDSGYTVIRKYAKKRIADSYLENYIMLPESASKEDVGFIREIWKEICPKGSMGYKNIYNRTRYSYGRGYESVRKMPIITSSYDIDEALDILLREKEGTLNKDEQEMLSIYREFDFRRTLTSNRDVKKYPINNDNSCIYIITPEEIVKSNVRNVRHLWQEMDAFSNLYFEEYIGNKREESPEEEAENYNSIIVEFSTTSGVPILPWIPRKINSFQYDELVKLCEKLEKIKEETGIEFDETIFFDLDRKERSSNISGFKEMLEENRSVLVDDLVKSPKRVSFPTREDITEEELDSALDFIEDELVAEKIKGELSRQNASIERGKKLLTLPEEKDK